MPKGGVTIVALMCASYRKASEEQSPLLGYFCPFHFSLHRRNGTGEQRASLGVQMSLKGLLKAKADFKWGRELGLQGV